MNPIVRDFLAGAGAGVASVFAGHPLDTVRVYQQAAVMTSRKKGWQYLLAALMNQPLTVETPGTIATLRQLFSTGGLYRGVFYPATTIALQSAVVFQANGIASRYLTSDPKVPLSYSQVALAGCFAGLAQLPIIVPVELLKIRAQMASGVPLSPTAAVRKVLAEGGLKGFLRGSGITFWRDVPCYAVYFTTYEGTREWFEPGSRALDKSNSSAVLLFSGGLAGAMSWLCVYPLDVIKTRVCLETTPLTLSWGKSLAAARQGQLFAGLGSTMVRGFIVNSVMFYCVDVLTKLMGGP